MANKGIRTEKPPIPKDKLAELEKAARNWGGDTERAFFLFRYTAMHPSVIGPYDYSTGKTADRDLREEFDEKHRKIIVWTRPKKKGIDGRTSILKHRYIYFDVKEYAEQVKARHSKYKRSRQYFWDLMRRLGSREGIILSPNSFRHTLAVEMRRAKVPEPVICQSLNITRETLRKYDKFVEVDRNDELADFWGL